MQVWTAAERPDLLDAAWEATKDVLPEYNNHGDVLGQYWGRLVPERAEFQFTVVDGEAPVARARCVPVRWDGTVEGLPAGIDGAVARAFDEEGADVLCALLIAVAPGVQGRGVSRVALEGMVGIARAHGFPDLIAPVRPSWKERYPLAPIARYAAWVRDDGLPLDPWMRVHARMGATVLKPEPESLRITGTVAEWEAWVGMPFPETGEYVFPQGLAPVSIDREADVGAYWEPNVWMRHRLS